MIFSRRFPSLRGILVVAAAVCIPALAGCEAGANAPTQNWPQTAPGTAALVNGTIRINNMFVLGAAPDSALVPGDSASMFLAITNEGAPDLLTGITAPGTARSVLLADGTVGLGARDTVLLTGPQPQVILEDLTRTLTGGQTLRVVLHFQRAGTVTLTVPVMPRAADFATLSPPPPTPAATSGGGSTPQPSPAPASPSGTPAPSPSPTG